MQTTSPKIGPGGAPVFGERGLVFTLLLAASLALYWKPLKALLALCLSGDSYSHIILIPFIALFLVVSERRRIFQQPPHFAVLAGAVTISAGLATTCLANWQFYSNGGRHLPGTILGLVLVWAGVFLACFGIKATRSAAFPLLFLFLMVPLPDALLSRVIAALQQGSVEISYWLFKAFGVPVLRQGVLLSVPGVTIEVAKECSSIRSSMALFITCILASRFYLHSAWKRVFFVLLSLPVSVIKNGIRITTLTLLSIYVNPGFLHGDLHRDGGFVFFLLALVILWPVLTSLRHSERSAEVKSGGVASGHELARG
jgi:exosortase